VNKVVIGIFFTLVCFFMLFLLSVRIVALCQISFWFCGKMSVNIFTALFLFIAVMLMYRRVFFTKVSFSLRNKKYFILLAEAVLTKTSV